MSIEILQRATLAGLTADKAGVLADLQSLGCLHLIPLRPPSREPEKDPPAHAVDALTALRYLSDVPDPRRQVRRADDFDLAATLRAVLSNKQRLRDVTDLRDALRVRVENLTPWGDFTLPPESDLAGRKFWFYILARRQLDAGLRERLQELDLPWQVVHSDHRQVWLVVIHPEEPPRDALPVARVHAGARRLAEVQRQLEAAELELENVLAERHALTRWNYLIGAHLAAAEDAAQLRYAAAQTLDPQALFLVQGWVPARAVPALQALAEARGLGLLLESPGADDAPPTLLDNPAPVAAGEDLVGFYQMPAYNAWDPSGVLFFSFAAFFAMILSDAGYAVLLGLLLTAYWGRIGRSDTGRRLRLLAAALVGTSTIWGVLAGGYFGFPPPHPLLAALAVVDLNDLASMMRLSIGIGVAHLVLANLSMAWAFRWRAPARVALGWALVIAASFVLWLGSAATAPPPWLQPAALGAIGLGLASMLLLGSDRRIDGLKALLLRLVDGLKNLLRVTQAFGDVMSYLRLFALGLASASLAITFNGLAREAAAEMPGVGLLFAILILLVGHTLNLTLTIVSGVVHGLRLNFIEFYNWALSGEGYPFKPFKRTELRE